MMTSANYEMYEAFEEEANQGLRASRLRDVTSKQKFNTGARYRRRSSGATGASGSHRRREKRMV